MRKLSLSLEDYGWMPFVLGLELKKAFSYRLNFWVSFLMGTATDITVSYFLWLSVFAYQNAPQIEGFTFRGLMFYSLFASFAGKIARGSDYGYISTDIYDGGLTRYLLYPISFFAYKYVTHLTQQFLAIIQLMIALGGLFLLLGAPPEQNISLGSVVAGCATSVLAGYAVFTLMSCLEMIAFWQDVVWNLMVMLRFAMSLLGGGLIPLALFPEWGRKLVELTPFPTLISFPARTFLGAVTLEEWGHSALILFFWSVLLTLLARAIWARGTRRYSGVGL